MRGAGDEERVGIFRSCGTTIRACNRKGKEHLKFNTNLAEPIRSLHVEAEEIYAGGEYIFSQFTKLLDLMQDALILAKTHHFDVFNALDILDNETFLKELKFGIGDGHLQYYLYNWKCQEMDAPDVGLVLL